MSEDEARKRLRDFSKAVLGIDDKGDGTCEICGRTGVRVVRKSSINRNTKELMGRVWLCHACLKDDFRSDFQAGDVGDRMQEFFE